MASRSTCQTADFLVLRTPGLPLDTLAQARPLVPGPEGGDPSGTGLEADRESLRQALRALLQQDLVREALALASPDLAPRLEAWLEGRLEGPAARNMERALVKYLSRMSSRSTPFGLFAGVSMGAWGPASHLSVGAWRDCRKEVRLDWGLLEGVVDRLAREPEVRAALAYAPNSSLYARGGWYRYQERRDQAGEVGRTYHLESVEATPHLDFVLRRAKQGARLMDLGAGLAQHLKVEPAEVRAFLDCLVDAQVLAGGLHPPLSSPDPLGDVTAALQAHTATAPAATPLLRLAAAIKAFQAAPLGAHPTGHQALAAPLAELGLPPGTRDILHVELFRPAPGLALSPVVRQALEQGAETLRRLTAPPREGPLERFRTAFLERYGARWVPLLEALDEESGLGFDGGAPPDSPLLEGLSLPRAAPVRAVSRRDQVLLAQLPQWQGAHRWELGAAEVEALAEAEPQPFPSSFAALASLEAASPAALDRGDFRFWMEQYSGPTAARWLARFASGDPDLEEALRRHLRKEEALRPEVLFAEVVHVPGGRMGNVLARPALRDYEIPFLAPSGVAPERRLDPSDLRLTVRGNRVHLASARLGREVVPRLSSAHNFARGPAVYRFLAHLQDQDGRPGGWSWGVLAEQPFLPRVSHGRHILSKARWRIAARELLEAGGSAHGAWGAFQTLRELRGLPRFVVLTDADNGLLVDLDQVLWVETLHHLVSGRPAFTLTECFPDPGQTLVRGPEGGFAHELVIPFEARPAPPPQAVPLPAASQAPVVRSYPPGSEWLYLKLYCGPASADRLLVDLAPLLGNAQREGLFDRWHFLRYGDPDHHLRIRFHGHPAPLLAELLPCLHSHLEEPLASGLLRKWQADTFEPEWERYGGPRGFPLAERWFFEDSRQVLDLLVRGLTQEERWRFGLRQTDAIWSALGLDVPGRKALAQALRDAFRREFGDAGAGAAQMGARFRAHRKDLTPGFPRAEGPVPPPGLLSLADLRSALDQGLLEGNRADLAGSLSHMHLNRLFRTQPRECEWVLMEYLVRLYESALARA